MIRGSIYSANMLKLCRQLWCTQCHSTAHLRLCGRGFHRRPALAWLYYPELLQKGACTSGAHAVISHPRTLGSFARIPPIAFFPGSQVPCWNFLAASTTASLLKTNSCLPFHSQHVPGRSAHGRSAASSAQQSERDKEQAVLSEYGRTYSPSKRYTNRQMSNQEAEDENLEQENSDDTDLRPEDMFGTLTNKYEKKVST